MKEKRHIYTVSELTRKVKVLLEENFPAIWVEGEISNLSCPSSGHMYITLKDESSVLKAVVFKNTSKDLKFQLKNGMQVICFGKIDVYAPQGQYQIKVFKIEPKGIGALQMAFEQLKERLKKEGLFDQKHKQDIPFLPQRIGVVTSATGAAFRDILHVLNRRFANLEITLNPVKVQGEGSAEEIAQAIDDFSRFGKVDVLIVGRGGGSLEDLWAFNEEVVARAIYRCRIPVISAVGHEIDYTIADFVSDLRVPTPSAAAEQVITHKQELLERIENFYLRAKRTLDNKIELLEHKLSSLKERYAFRQPADLIEQHQQRIDELVSILTRGVGHLAEKYQERHKGLVGKLHALSPLNILSQHQQRVDELTSTLTRGVRYLAEKYQERHKGLVGKLHALSPLNILSRGYSITVRLPEEKAITRASTLKPGAKIKTQVDEGAFISKVEEILQNGRDEI